MAYPTTIDNFTNPASGDPLNSPSHSTQHTDLNNAVEALEAKVGADSSAVTSSHDYKLSDVSTGNKAESSANKETSALDTSTTKYPCNNVVKEAVDAKMSNPMSATGDIIYGGASGVATRLAKGDDGQILELDSGTPAWKTKGVTPINAQTDNYTLVLSDTGKLITLTSSSAITLTIPTNASVAFPIGTQIDLSQMGDGKVTFAGAGVTINSKGGNKAIADKFVGVSLIKTDTDTWLLLGDLK
jgi:hypothetical protein